RLPDLHRAEVWSLVFSPDGTRLASASDDGTARLWDVATGRPIGGPLRHPGNPRVLSAAFRPDGARIVTAQETGTGGQLDAGDGACGSGTPGQGLPWSRPRSATQGKSIRRCTVRSGGGSLRPAWIAPFGCGGPRGARTP